MICKRTNRITHLSGFVLLFILFRNDMLSEAQPHVCVIGAGISAASASHFLSIHSSPLPKITVFEKTDRSGGRIATICLSKTSCFEAGASIIAAENSLMAYFVEFLNLTRSDNVQHSETFGFWNGTSFVFRSQPSRFRTLLALSLRYRLSLFRMRLFIRRLLKMFSKIYPDDGPGSMWKACKTVEELLAKAAPLYEETQHHFSYTVRDRFSKLLIDEMVAAITRVNYGQDVEAMNTMAGSVGLAGSGSGLWSVAGGNEQVVSGLLRRANVDLQLETRITQIDKSEGGFVVMNEKSKWFCDAIIMAVPAEVAEIRLPADILSKLHVNRKFQRTVSTFIRGTLNKETFGPNSPDAILTTSNVEDVFTSVAKKGGGDVQVFKIFSREPLSKRALARMFEPDPEVLAEYPWLAYPKYAVPEVFADFDIGRDRIFIYTSPLESAGSAMEMSAIAGANAAALVRDKLGLHVASESPAEKEEV